MCDSDSEFTAVRWPDLTPQSRAAKATYLLMIHGELPTRELAERLGYANNNGVNWLMNNISANVPVFQPHNGVWAILRGENGG